MVYRRSKERKKECHPRIWTILGITISMEKHGLGRRSCYRRLCRFTEAETSISFDSQAPVKALSAYQVNSRMVGSLLNALNKLDTRDKVTLAGVPEQKGHKEVDAKARKGAPMRGSDLFGGVPKACTRTSIQS